MFIAWLYEAIKVRSYYIDLANRTSLRWVCSEKRLNRNNMNLEKAIQKDNVRVGYEWDNFKGDNVELAEKQGLRFAEILKSHNAKLVIHNGKAIIKRN